MTVQAPRVYERRGRTLSWLARGNQLRVRMAARAGSLFLLGSVIAGGLIQGGYLSYDNSPWLKLPGKAAGVVGMAAEDITITGLTNHDPEILLAAIGMAPGSPLIGFDALLAKRILENLDWIENAKVMRRFPNQLDIEITEREPFAVWQRGQTYLVIDRSGAAMSGFSASHLVKLPLVTGEGANTAAAELVNQLEAYPDLLLQVKAAARVGGRRWTLYLDSGVTILLPEENVLAALKTVADLDRSQQLLSKGIRSVDMRLDGRVVVDVAEVAAIEDGKAKKKVAKSR